MSRVSSLLVSNYIKFWMITICGLEAPVPRKYTYKKITKGGSTLATEKLYNMFPRGGRIHPLSQHLPLQLFEFAQRVELPLHALDPLPYLISIVSELWWSWALRTLSISRSIQLTWTPTPSATATDSATSIIVSFKIYEAACPSRVEAAFKSPLNIKFLSGGYVMVHVALDRQDFVEKRPPHVIW